MAAKELSKSTVIGVFEGECADSNVTNENGLDITREVWENTFASQNYKEGIENGWFIGFLGHPDDPGTNDFRHACIVMTEGHIADDGKIYGKFNLIDTPVGRVVKSFIDAGVQFGISVRGAGDIINNSVDPDTFVFRGFDLVSFPAYREAIPEFAEIAASSNLKDQQKYKRICASVEKELSNISSCNTLDAIQKQFPVQSETYKELADRKDEIKYGKFTSKPEERLELVEAQNNGLMNLYLQKVEECKKLQEEVKSCQKISKKQDIKMSRRNHVIDRIFAAQKRDLDKIESENIRLRKKYNESRTQSITAENKNKKLHSENRTLISANSKLKDNLESLKEVEEVNLQYNEKIEASERVLASKDETIERLKKDLDKTVAEVESYERQLSNRDAEIGSLKKEVLASESIIEEYQDAYASMYSKAIGSSSNLEGVRVTASTSVDELQELLSSKVCMSDISDVFVEPQQVYVDDEDDNELVTL